MHLKRTFLRYNLCVSEIEIQEEVGETEALEIETGTQLAFAEGAEFAGLFVKVAGSGVLAIAILIAFYLFQRSRKVKI